MLLNVHEAKTIRVIGQLKTAKERNEAAAVARYESNFNAVEVHPSSMATGAWQVVPVVLADYNDRHKTKMEMSALLDPTVCHRVWHWYWNWLGNWLVGRQLPNTVAYRAWCYVVGVGRIKEAVARGGSPHDAETPWEYAERVGTAGMAGDPHKLAYVRKVSGRAEQRPVFVGLDLAVPARGDASDIVAVFNRVKTLTADKGELFRLLRAWRPLYQSRHGKWAAWLPKLSPADARVWGSTGRDDSWYWNWVKRGVERGTFEQLAYDAGEAGRNIAAAGAGLKSGLTFVGLAALALWLAKRR